MQPVLHAFGSLLIWIASGSGLATVLAENATYAAPGIVSNNGLNGSHEEVVRTNNTWALTGAYEEPHLVSAVPPPPGDKSKKPTGYLLSHHLVVYRYFRFRESPCVSGFVRYQYTALYLLYRVFII